MERTKSEENVGRISSHSLTDKLELAENAPSASENSSEMFLSVENRVEELEQALVSFNNFLQQQEMYSYVQGIVNKFFTLSTELKGRMQDISTLYSFLDSYHLSASRTAAGYFSVLPQELCLHVLSFLDWRDLNNIALLNRQWRDLSRDNMLWKGMCYSNWKRVDDSFHQEDRGDSSPEASSPDSSSDERERRLEDQRSKKRLKKSWKDLFMKRLRVEDNWRTGNCVPSKIIAQGDSAAFCLQFDDQYLVTATDVIQLLDVNTGECVRTMQGHRDSVMCLDFNKQYIVSGSKDNNIRVWDTNTGACINVLEGHDNGVRTLRFDGRQIVSGARDSTIKLWDMHTGELQNTLRGHHYTVYCLELDKRFIVSGSVDKTIRLWDRDTGQELKTMKGHTNSIRCLKFDQTTIVSGAWDNRVMVWDLETGKEIHRFEGHADRVMCVQFDERKIVSGSVDKLIKIWDLRADGACHTLAGHDYTVYHLAFDDYKIRSASKDRTVITWDFTTEVPLEKRKGVEIIHSVDTSTHHISSNGSIVRNWSVGIPNTASSASSAAAATGAAFNQSPTAAPPGSAQDFNLGAPPTNPNGGGNASSYNPFYGRLYPPRSMMNMDMNTLGGSNQGTNLNNNNNNNNNTNNSNGASNVLGGFTLNDNNTNNNSNNTFGGAVIHANLLENMRRRRDRKPPLFGFTGGRGTTGAPRREASGEESTDTHNATGMMSTGGMLGMRDRLRHFGYPTPPSLVPSFHQPPPFASTPSTSTTDSVTHLFSASSSSSDPMPSFPSRTSASSSSSAIPFTSSISPSLSSGREGQAYPRLPFPALHRPSRTYHMDEGYNNTNNEGRAEEEAPRRPEKLKDKEETEDSVEGNEDEEEEEEEK